MTILERVKIRLKFEEDEIDIINDLITTAKDRILLRIGEFTSVDFPLELESIVVEVVIKAYRRVYYEGISSEGSEGINTTFADILEEFSYELERYKTSKHEKVRFL